MSRKKHKRLFASFVIAGMGALIVDHFVGPKVKRKLKVK